MTETLDSTMTREPAGEPAEAGRRELNKARTRAALVDAALSLALERPIETLTAEQVADAAGVSRRTFFNYFPSVEALLATGAVDTEGALRAALDARPIGESLLASFKAVMEEIFTLDLLAQSAIVWRVVGASPAAHRFALAASATAHMHLAEEWASERFAARGCSADPLQAPLVMATTMAALEVARNDWLRRHPGPIDAAAREDFIATVNHAADLIAPLIDF